MIPLEPRQQLMLQELRRSGPHSRWELHSITGIRPNTVGSDVGELLRARIVREMSATGEGRGRPRVPLEIDPLSRHVLGLAIRPGHVDVAKLNLLGAPLSEGASVRVERPEDLVRAACGLLREARDADTLAVGLSTPGFVDATTHEILLSSAAGDHALSLQPVYDVAGDLCMALENDMHALAARWLLTHERDQDEDVLLVYFDDGQLGAAILINGRPNRGCVIGGNELGHTRLPVETDRCYCGHEGCLERIVSTGYLKRLGEKEPDLRERIAAYKGKGKPMAQMIQLFATGVANAVTFTRPNRLVLVSELTQHEGFAQAVVGAIRLQLLEVLAKRVQIDLWAHPASSPAQTAGWLALANLYYQGWEQAAPHHAASQAMRV